MAGTKEASKGSRGPARHAIKDQIIEAAAAHFHDYGYGKTTVTDLAVAIGFSKAYIYRFFPSKQAIGEAISSRTIDDIVKVADLDMDTARSASDKIRRLFRGVTRTCVDLLKTDPQLFEIITLAVVEKWSCNRFLDEKIEQNLRAIVIEGRRQGEFERKTPLDETCRAIAGALRSYTHPLMLTQDPDGALDAEDEVIAMVLRSLAESE